MFFPDELLHELEEAAAAWALVKAFRKLLWNQ